MLRKLITVFVCALVLAGCFKSVSYKTTYVLKPLLQLKSGADENPLENAIAYAYAVDTTSWTVASYDEALAGIITSRRNPTEKIDTPIATSEPYELEGTTGWLQLAVSNPSVMVVVVDPENKLYGFRQQPLGENLPHLYSSIIFRPWKASYYEKPWFMRNEFYVPPKEVAYYVKPLVQAKETEEAVELEEVKVYAYGVDTAEWRITSYNDASAGIITSKTDPTKTQNNPTFRAYIDKKTGNYMMTVTEPVLMVVVVDTKNKRYAYSRQNIDVEADPVTSTVTFRLWKTGTIYVEEDWRYVWESYKEPEQ